MTHDILMQESIMFACMTVLAGFVLWLLFRRKQTIHHLEYHRLEVLNKMIDKYGSSAEFISFMQTDAGKRLIQNANGQPNGKPSGSVSVLRFIQVGVMLFVLGGGFMAQADMYGPDTAYWGIMCFMLAIGLWIVAIVTILWNWLQNRSSRRLAATEARQL
jgi:hypothetical protein